MTNNIHEIEDALSAWRAAERRASDAEPGTRVAAEARVDAERSRRRYQVLFEQSREADTDWPSDAGSVADPTS